MFLYKSKRIKSGLLTRFIFLKVKVFGKYFVSKIKR